MKSEYFINKENFRKHFITLIEETFVIKFEESTKIQQYTILVDLIKKHNANNWYISNSKQSKEVYYFTNELNNNILKNNLVNLNILDTVSTVLNDLNIDVNELFEIEKTNENNLVEILDSATTLNLNVNAFLLSDKESVWELEKEAYDVNLYGEINFNNEIKIEYTNYQKINVKTYETAITGYKNDLINKIKRINFNSNNKLINEYVLSSVAAQSIVNNDCKLNLNSMSYLVIPELMRIYMDEFNYSWEESLLLVEEKCIVNNETCFFNKEELKNTLPRIFSIIEEFNKTNNVIENDNIYLNKLICIYNIYDLDILVSQRKWCMNYNDELNDILNEYCGNWIEDTSLLSLLNKSINKRKLQKKIRNMKLEEKKQFINKLDLDINCSSLFSYSNKIGYMTDLYYKLKIDFSFKDNFHPTTFVTNTNFDLIELINNDHETNHLLKIVFTNEDCIKTIDIVEEYDLRYVINGSLVLSNYEEINDLYKQEALWYKEVLNNIIKLNSNFSDNVIENYNNKVWKLSKTKVV